MKQKGTIVLYTVLLTMGMLYFTITNVQASERQIINANIGHYPPSGTTVTFQDVEIGSNYAYISDTNLPGLRVVLLTNPSNPTLIASTNVTSTSCYEIEIANGVAYLRVMENQDYDIEYINISNPFAPVYGGLLDLNMARGFDAAGEFLFVNNGTEVLSYNFTNLSNPLELDRLDLGESGQSLTFIDSLIFVCTSGNNLKILNASDPENLVIISSTNLGDFYAESFLLKDDVLYASGLDSTKTDLPERVHRGYVISIDLSNKSNPTPLSDLFIDGINGVGMAIVDTKLFVGACAEGIKVIDITNSSLLKSIGYYDDYQDIYCNGSASYALYPKLFDDVGLGNLIVFVSSGCGLNVISADGLKFESNGTIPGYEPLILVAIVFIFSSLIYRKLKNN